MWLFSGFSMYSATAAWFISISQAGIRPLPSNLGSRRSDIIATSTFDSTKRIWSCWWGGKNEIMRVMVSVAFMVCRVLITKWPVSAALMAVSMVSQSRISPMRMMSGSWRKQARRALLKEGASEPISRWAMMLRLSRCRNSMGSSMVTMLTDELELMWSIIEASRVDLPLPVVPVTRIMPRFFMDMSMMTLGRASSEKLGTSTLMERTAMAGVPRWRKAFILKRPTPGSFAAKSISESRWNLLYCSGVSSERSMASMLSSEMGSEPSLKRSPLRRMMGTTPQRMCRSEAFWSIIAFSSAWMFIIPAVPSAFWASV